VLANIAPALGLQARLVYDQPAEDSPLAITDWVLLARDAAAFDAPPLAGRAQLLPPDPSRSLWTDRFNDLLEVLRTHPRDEFDRLRNALRARFAGGR